MKTRQKSRLDSRLVEAFNQLKEIQNNINETEKVIKFLKGFNRSGTTHSPY